MNIIKAIADFFRSLFGMESSEQPQIHTPQPPKNDGQPPIVPVKDNTATSPQTQPKSDTSVTEPQVDTPPSNQDIHNLMTLRILRYSIGSKDSLGKLYINNEFYCYTLEDEHRKEKIAGESCIPLGEYDIIFRKVGGMNDTYTLKYPDIHKGMLWLQNVPGFKFVLIHIGNTKSDAKGSILLGNAVVGESNTNQERQISGSKNAYYKVYPIVAAHLERGGKVKIRIEE